MSKKIRKTLELHLRVGNTVNAGAELFRELRDAGVDVVATCCYRIGEEAHLSFIPGQPDKARAVLEEQGLESNEEDVLLIELADEAGSFAKLLEHVGSVGVQTHSAYVTPSTSGPGLAVLKTSNNDAVATALTEAEG